MFKMHPDDNNPPDSPPLPVAQERPLQHRPHTTEPEGESLLHRVKHFFSGPTPANKEDETLKEALEECLDMAQDVDLDTIVPQERLLFSNILNLRDEKVADIMIPRSDIASLEVSMPREELFKFLTEHPHSRFPVYRETLDNVLGTVHIKDIMFALMAEKSLKLKDFITDMPFVSPALPILDLLLEMRHTRRHMALVVDEYGGIDGLVTMGDVLESIIGEIDDEHDQAETPQIVETKDGALIADGRLDIEKFEERFGLILSEEEREESDTLGGLVFAMAGRIPSRGEILTHSTGMTFEILEADPRRISRLKIRNIPASVPHES